MVVSNRSKASASQSNSNDLRLVCAEPEPLKSSIEESADDPSDIEDDSEISNEEESFDGEQIGDEILSATMVGEGHKEEQIANQVNDEEKDPANEMNEDRAEDGSPRHSMEVSEEVSDCVVATSVAENQGKVDDVPEEDKEQMQDGKGVEAGAESRTSDMAAEGNIDNNEGSSAYGNRITEANLGENMQTEEANKVKAEELVTPKDNEKSESKGEDSNTANDTKPGIQKVARPRRKVLKKKVVKKVVVRDNVAPVEEPKLQSSVRDEASNEIDKGKGTEEEMKTSGVSVGKNVIANESSSASERNMSEEQLAENIKNEEANKMSAEVPMATPADNDKIESAGDDAKVVDNKSVTDGVGRPKRKVVKKKVVKKKTTVQNDATLIDETKLQSGNGDKAETNEMLKNEDKGVLRDNENTEVTGDLANNVKAETEKANGPKGTVSKKQEVNKVAQGNAVASVSEPKAQISIVSNASGKENETDKAKDGQIEEKSEEKPAVPVNKKRKRVRRRKVPKAHADAAITSGERKPEVTNNEAGSKENKETDGKNAKAKGVAKPEDKASDSKNRQKKKVTRDDRQKAIAGGRNAPGPSEKGKSSKKVDGMGMVFMCSSETKMDCYRYKVLGLPAGKKDIVSKIYKGMRLFLFDVDLRMMYGIYKAAEPGGYNIEPRAFKSQFPAQVRFTVIKDCLPLVEEKFRSVIKDNYFTKNKFNGQLTNEQVKNLCKLFIEASRDSGFNPVSPPSPSRKERRKRKRVEEAIRARSDGRRKASRVDDSREARRREARHVSPDRRSRRRESYEELRRSPILLDDRYHHRDLHRPVVYEREVYRPPPPALPRTIYHLEPRTSAYSYDYEEATRADIEVYRRDPALDHRRLELHGSRDWDRPAIAAAPSSLDPYAPYRETARAYREPEPTVRAYREPEPTVRAYREPEPVYETGSRRDIYESVSLRPAEYYGAADYPAPLPPYRRY